MYTVCTWYIPGQSIHIPVVPTGFRGQHRDGVWSDLPLPSSAREDEDEGSPCPEDGDFFYARPDATETEEAISKFISGLECQEQSCFERLHTLLSKLPVPVTTTGNKMPHSIHSCIRSVKLCCGETRITPRVKHQRYVQTCMYTFKLCMCMV